MRSTAWLALAMLTIALGACRGPEFLELDPKGHTFKRAGEEVWWKALAKDRNGKIFHKKTNIAWSSSDHTVATVDSVGRVRSVGAGSATIGAQLGELRAEAIVEVILVDRVSIEPSSLTLKARGTGQKLQIKVFDKIGRDLKDRLPVPRCMDEAVCRTSNDEVVPVDPGQTQVVVSIDGKRAEIPVTVEK